MKFSILLNSKFVWFKPHDKWQAWENVEITILSTTILSLLLFGITSTLRHTASHILWKKKPNTWCIFQIKQTIRSKTLNNINLIVLALENTSLQIIAYNVTEKCCDPNKLKFNLKKNIVLLLSCYSISHLDPPICPWWWGDRGGKMTQSLKIHQFMRYTFFEFKCISFDI